MELHFPADYHLNRAGTAKGRQDFDRAFPPLYLLPNAATLVLRMVLLERLGLEFFGRLVPWAPRDWTGNWDYPSDQVKVSSG